MLKPSIPLAFLRLYIVRERVGKRESVSTHTRHSKHTRNDATTTLERFVSGGRDAIYVGSG